MLILYAELMYGTHRMKNIRIRENTSIHDVGEWMKNTGATVTFEILYKSSFQLFAEGVALGVLRSLFVKQTTINIKFYKTPFECNDIELTKIQPIFKSIFGLELLRLTKSIYDENGIEKDFRSIMGNTLWQSVLDHKGHIGDGKRAYLVSRHDYEIPRCLRKDESSSEFPRYDYFQSSLSSYLLGLRGYTNTIGPCEKVLIEWLHHIAENVHEHGRFSKFENDLIDGFRGIILGKYVFRDEIEIEKRGDIPPYIKTYVKKLINAGKCPSKNITFNYATVMDVGDGIQNTLNIADNKDKFDTLCLAFNDGVTRKTKLMSEKSGYGLGQALKAACDINAFFHIVSSNIETYIDFSDIQSNKNSRLLSQPEYLDKKHGTSISLLWLSESRNKDGII